MDRLHIAVPCDCVSKEGGSKWVCRPEVLRMLLHRLVVEKEHRGVVSDEVLIKVHIHPSIYEELQRAWSIRVLVMVRRTLEMERIMWTLSTLGGAYSAMGDYEDEFIWRAAHTSLVQLRLAQKWGDRVMQERCRLYCALALAQWGHWTHVKRIIKKAYFVAVEMENELLQSCSRGVWAKVRAIRLALREKED